MQVLRPQPACRTDLHSRFDHRWWSGDIDFQPSKSCRSLATASVTKPVRQPAPKGASERTGVKVRWVPLRQILEMVDEIEIAVAARSEIDMDQLLHAACNGRLDDPFDRRKARAAGDT